MGVTPRRVAFAVFLLVLVAVGAYLLGVRTTRQATWHTVTVDLSNVAAVGPVRFRFAEVSADTGYVG